MIYASVCSGIEAPTVAWEPLGWKAAWYSEIEPFPCAVLQHHCPETPNLGDMTKIHERKEFNDPAINLLIGGTPCQSFSVAGLRKGLADPRGNLALVFLSIVDRIRPAWVVWENVPGVLSSNKGRDFGAFLGALAELGYGFAYRILDAQNFGVPQRRRRVFVVGYFGDWRPAASVLFERHSLSGDTPPIRKKGERVAPSVTSGPPFSRTGLELVEVAAMVAVETGQGWWKTDSNTGPLRAEGENRPSRPSHIVMAHGQGNAEIRRDGSPSLTCNHEAPIVVTPINTQIAFRHNALGKRTGLGIGDESDPAFTLQANHHHAVAICTAQTSANGHGIAEVKLKGEMNGELDDRTLESEEDLPAGPVRDLRCGGCGSTPQKRKLARQQAREFRENVQELSHENPQAETEMQSGIMPATEQEVRLLRETQPKIQKIWDAIRVQKESTQPSSVVRRLTPREAERLQGFPDDYTLVPYRGKPAADGPRYKALGNSMAVPCIFWIGKRIEAVEKVLCR